MTLTLNSQNLDDWANYFATWNASDPYTIMYNLVPNIYGTQPYITDYRQQEKVINIEWTLKFSTTSWLWTWIRYIKSKIIWQNKTITIVDKEWTSFSWLYSCSSIEFDENYYNLTWIKYKMKIIITWYLESSTEVSKTSTATGTLWSLLDANTWWFAYSRIRWTWNTGSSLTKIQFVLYDSSVSFPEDQKDQVLEIYPVGWSNWDYIDIDWKTQTITKNWSTWVDFYWIIPVIPNGVTNQLSITATWTSINFTNITKFYITMT